MTLLMQISDPHFGTEQPAVVDALKRLVAQLRPDIVVMSGDITQRARPAEFRAARAFLDDLIVPVVLAIPGNHDIPLYNVWARLFKPYANHIREFGRNLEPEFDGSHMFVVTVNTTRVHRHKNGEISADQIDRVCAWLAKARPSQLRVVVVHHPVAVTRSSDVDDLLRGRETAILRWAKAGADLVLGGHIHLPFVVPLHERQPELPRRLWAVQAGTALSTRVRHGVPNSVNLIRYDGSPPCKLERWDYSAKTQSFQQATAAELHPGSTY